MKFASVIIDISCENVDRPYSYIIPESLESTLEIGSQVNVPFGKGNNLRKGFVIDIKNESDYPVDKLKYIDSVSEKDISITDKRIKLSIWMKRNYGSTLIASLKTVLPVKMKVKPKENKTVVSLLSREETLKFIEESISKRNSAQVRLLNALTEEGEIPKKIVNEKLHISDQTIKKLEEKGALKITGEISYRNPVKKDYGLDRKQILSKKQEEIVSKIREDQEAGLSKTYLLHGITGSGKTEVYMQVIEDNIKRGKQAIVLIPEIALTFQTLMRFYKRFGERVSIMNSTLSPGEKYDQYERAKKGEIDIIIGPRSALFVPFERLGIIVIDEEHEGSYKSETSPKYHARETAIEIARMSQASVLLGSATPSIDSYYKAEKGEYELFKLNERLTGNTLPNVFVADLRHELKKGNRTIISKKLEELMEDRLNKKEQIMLFLNRRGFAGFISCRACGFVVKCPHCDVSLSLHGKDTLMCHYCGYTRNNITSCPECGSKYVSGFKAGTEQVEETVKKMFPGVRTLRMDADTTREKENYEKILSSFLDGEADVLIGTQMIVKGHDFKQVTLVGILAADMSLFQADFKASEKTFDLLTQAAGRAGRGDKPGDVVIQTYQPEHYAIRHALKQDYEGFYEEEIGYRELMDYPPAGHLLNILVSSKNEKEAKVLVFQMSEAIRKYYDSQVIGPAPAVFSKLNDVYRFVFYIKDQNLEKLMDIKDYLEESLLKIKNRKASVIFDFDPYNFS